jgi:hypothetical protein
MIMNTSSEQLYDELLVVIKGANEANAKKYSIGIIEKYFGELKDAMYDLWAGK